MLTELLQYVSANERVCPQPQKWSALWEMLPGRRRVGQGWEPALPLILAAWWETSAAEKVSRLGEHLRHAEAQGALAPVDAFLRSLTEEEWAHSGDF